MKQTLKTLPLCALVLLAGCATHDNQDRFVLGEATRQNIAEQSVRDVNLPNSRPVESNSGVRAAKAVQALNEGKTKQLAETATGAAQ